MNIDFVLVIVSIVACCFDIVDGNCSINNGGCQHRCTDVIGDAVQCQCEPGYKLYKDGQTCNDIDECLVNNGGCSGVCENKPGSFECSCKSGSLSLNGHTCVVAMLLCHECDTYQKDSGCDDPIDGDDNIVECEHATHCLKLKTQVSQVDTTNDLRVSKRTVVSRQCAWAPHVTSGCTTFVGAGARYKRCYCDTDGCNRSPRIALHIASLVATFLVALFFI